MPDPKRVEFITRHFKDLQSIRFAPIPALMLLMPVADRFPPVSVTVARALALGFLCGIVGFYWWSTVAIKRRYGSVKASRNETQQMQGHPVLVAIYAITAAALLWFKFIAPDHTHLSDVFVVFAVLTAMLPKMLDSTNLAVRRVVWAIGLVMLFAAGSFLIRVDRGDLVAVLGGAVWLSISIFDFLLLRRTFEGISESPSGGATEVAANFG